MRDVRDLSLAELEDLVVSLGESRFRGEQIFRWVHMHGVTSWDAMKNVSAATRAKLAEKATLGALTIDEVQTSSDGTRKLRLRTHDGFAIESVLIPDGDKMTQCISSQVGCALDCDFCATAKLGFARHLAPGEIVDQVYRAREVLGEQRVTNLVYMGMGEPLHNYDNVVKSIRLLTHDLGQGLSARRITVSTAGLVPGIEKIGREDLGIGLAVSLNATTDETRDVVMPVNKKWNLEKLLGTLKAYPLESRRRITFEYVLLADVNDSLADAARLARLLRGFKCKVNVIPWNPHPMSEYRRPAPERIEAFQNEVRRLGLPVYLRTPRGDDIDAACGQLANRAPGQRELVPLRSKKKAAIPA
jgi:23S rRNA (adenine2503-C2)-methyltransferase